MRPQPKPISTRMPKHRMNVCTGETASRLDVMMDAPLTASIKLTMPNTPPRIALAAGPSTMAPTAMGTVKNDMYSGPTGTLPRPMSFMTRLAVLLISGSSLFRTYFSSGFSYHTRFPGILQLFSRIQARMSSGTDRPSSRQGRNFPIRGI